MKSKTDNWIQYPTLIPYLFYLAHALYLPRLSKFLNDTTADYYYQWPIRFLLESFSNQSFAKWLIVIFCLVVYFFSIFYGRKKSVQFLVVITNFFYISMNSFPSLGINVYESYCFLYFSIAILFFDLSKKYFVDKYKVIMALAVSPYVLSGLIKIYHYKDFLTDRMLLNKIIEVEYFSTQTSFLIPFLKGYDIPTYPLFPLVIALQVSGLLAISSLRYRKFWIPSTLFFHLSNSILFNINFFFSFLVLPFSFFNSEEKKEKKLLISTFYFLLIFTGTNLYKLTTQASQNSDVSILRLYSMLFLIILFSGMFLYKKYSMRALVLIFLIGNAALFLTYNLPFSFADYIVLITLAFKFLKDPENPLREIKESLLKALVFIGAIRACFLIVLILEKMHIFNFSSGKIPDAILLMVQLPGENQWHSVVFLILSLLEVFFCKVYFRKWALPLLIAPHLYLACFSHITSSYYLIWVSSIIALSNLKDSTIPNKWTIAYGEI